MFRVLQFYFPSVYLELFFFNRPTSNFLKITFLEFISKHASVVFIFKIKENTSVSTNEKHCLIFKAKKTKKKNPTKIHNWFACRLDGSVWWPPKWPFSLNILISASTMLPWVMHQIDIIYQSTSTLSSSSLK